MKSIKAQHFVIFFETLREEYFKRDCKEFSSSAINTLDIWKKSIKNSKGKKVPLVSELFLLTSPDYLFRKYNAAKKLPKDHEVPIRELVLIKCLSEYLSIQPKETFTASSSNTDKADALWDAFLQKNQLELSQQKDGETVSRKTNEKPSKNHSAINCLVDEFVSFINKRKYFDAWLRLTPHYQFKSAWRGDYFSFYYSFVSVENISDIKIYDIDLLNNVVEARIFYRKVVKLFPASSAELFIWKQKSLSNSKRDSSLRKIDIKEYLEEDFEEKFDFENQKWLENEAKQNEIISSQEIIGSMITGLEKIVAQKNFNSGKLTSDQLRTHIYNGFRKDKKYIEQIFPGCETNVISIDGKCSFYYFENQWLINFIEGINPINNIHST